MSTVQKTRKQKPTGLGWSEAEVFKRLDKVFPSGAFILLPQVRNQTGYSRRVRTADALAVSVWPSRGLYFAGIEIKVSKSDWKHELADAEKSAEIQRFCQRWYAAVPEGLVDMGEVPATWGLIEVSEKGARISKPAPELQAKPVSMAFVCSVLRAMSEACVPREQVDERINESIRRLNEEHEQRRDRRYEELKFSVDQFEKASGVNIGARWESHHIGQAVKMVLEGGAMHAKEMLERLSKNARQIADVADHGLKCLQARPAEERGVEDPGKEHI